MTKKTKLTASQWVDKQLASMEAKQKKARRRYKILALVLAFINLVTIAVASVAITLIVRWSAANPNNTGGTITLVLTILSAALIIILFALNFGISIFKAYRKTKFYVEAQEKISIEAMKYKNKIGEYKKQDEKILEKNVVSIKNSTLKKKRSKDKKLKAILKGLTGGFDE